jgi:glutamate-1-semialdehyde 2,1-aminomutase
MEQASPFRASDRENSVRMKTPGSAERFRRAAAVLPGGVSSAVRRGARPYPLYFRCGDGARVVDVDQNAYLDYTLGWGPLLLGHAPPAVVDALTAEARHDLTYGAQHDLEIEVAERLVKLIPCADAVCFANSGTEIVQVALRLARAATGRQKYIKFEGHYHGWDDSVLISYHPNREEIENARERPIPVGMGQLPARTAVIAEWNNRASVEAAFAANPGKISALICEPLVCNSGCLPPEPGFLAFLRQITSANGALLIFDEVITGFRIALGGAQELYGVTPDLATYAKAVGAGVPLSVLAGKRQYMGLIADGRVIHAGSLNGNPVSLAAAKAALDALAADGVYERLRRNTDRLRRGLEELLSAHGLSAVTNGECGVFHIAFMDRPARTYRDTLDADKALYSDFALALLDEGVLVLPDGRWYVSTAHTEADIDATLEAAGCAFRAPSEIFRTP